METFKVLVFLMNKKANEQSIIYALTGFQKNIFSIKQKTFRIRFQKYAIFSAILTQKLVYFDLIFFFMIVI